MKSLKLISSAIAMLICFVSMAQERTISGIISDENKQPIPGANIFNKTSKANAVTNFDGQYSIQAKTGDLLVFSIIGYKSQSQRVQNSNTINIKLFPDNQTLNEMVVVGYGKSSSEYEDRSYARAERRREKKTLPKPLKEKSLPFKLQAMPFICQAQLLLYAKILLFLQKMNLCMLLTEFLRKPVKWQKSIRITSIMFRFKRSGGNFDLWKQSFEWRCYYFN